MKKAAIHSHRDPLMSFSLYAFSFSIGFFLYLFLEKIFKTYFSESPTHWSMGLCAGLAFLFLLTLDRYAMPLLIKALAGGVFITFSELVAGCIVNLRYRMNIWNYSDLPFNYHGQICLWFSLLWCLASIGIICLNRLLIRLLFSSPFPKK